MFESLNLQYINFHRGTEQDLALHWNVQSHLIAHLPCRYGARVQRPANKSNYNTRINFYSQPQLFSDYWHFGGHLSSAWRNLVDVEVERDASLQAEEVAVVLVVLEDGLLDQVCRFAEEHQQVLVEESHKGSPCSDHRMRVVHNTSICWYGVSDAVVASANGYHLTATGYRQKIKKALKEFQYIITKLFADVSIVIASNSGLNCNRNHAPIHRQVELHLKDAPQAFNRAEVGGWVFRPLYQYGLLTESIFLG